MRWNLCLRWKPGTVCHGVNSKDGEENCRKTAGEEAGEDWGNADSRCFQSPSQSVVPDGQSTSMPSGTQMVGSKVDVGVMET